MKKLILVFLMVFGMAVSVVSAWEYNSRKHYSPQEQAKLLIDGYEEFKAKYPKIYEVCDKNDVDSKYYVSYVCDKILDDFAFEIFGIDTNGLKRTYISYVREYGEEKVKAMMLKNGVMRASDALDKLELAFYDAEKFMKRNR